MHTARIVGSEASRKLLPAWPLEGQSAGLLFDWNSCCPQEKHTGVQDHRYARQHGKHVRYLRRTFEYCVSNPVIVDEQKGSAISDGELADVTQQGLGTTPSG